MSAALPNQATTTPPSRLPACASVRRGRYRGGRAQGRGSHRPAGEVIGLIGRAVPARAPCSSVWARSPSRPPADRIVGEMVYDGGWRNLDPRALRRDRHRLRVSGALSDSVSRRDDNVALPLLLAGRSNRDARQRARELLAALDVEHRARRPSPNCPRRTAAGRHRPGLGQPAADHSGRRADRAARQRTGAGGGADSEPDAQQYQTAIIVVTHDEKIIRPSSGFIISRWATYEEAARAGVRLIQ